MPRGKWIRWFRSLGRFAESVQVQQAHARGDLEALGVRRIGPGLAFGRLWEQLAIDRILADLLRGRRFSFNVERALPHEKSTRSGIVASAKKSTRNGR